MKEIVDYAAKRRYEQPRLSRVLLIPQEEMLLPSSWTHGHEDEEPVQMGIIEGDPNSNGKGAKTNGRFWDDSDEY